MRRRKKAVIARTIVEQVFEVFNRHRKAIEQYGITDEDLGAACTELNQPTEAELAEALDAYTDPKNPEYDAAFDREIRRLRPDWFGNQ